MTQTIEAIYTEGVLKPTAELSLRDNQRVRLTVETIDETTWIARLPSRA
jgi:predicted DNA-binding antitoxin AbrB/MazE fold protein